MRDGEWGKNGEGERSRRRKNRESEVTFRRNQKSTLCFCCMRRRLYPQTLRNNDQYVKGKDIHSLELRHRGLYLSSSTTHVNLGK